MTAADVLTRLDHRLFSPTGLFLIDAANRRIPHVTPSSMRDALARVSRGEAAAVVGHLNPSFWVVDVDVAGPGGDQITDEITAWLTDRGVWVLVRPSGGAPGRAHVFTQPGSHEDELRLMLEQLRDRRTLPYASVALLSTVRPLSSPHRTGVRTRPKGPLRPLLDALAASQPTRLPAHAGTPTRTPPRTPVRTADPTPPTTTALVPRPRRGRPIPQPWQRYLEHGIRPLLAGADHGPSTYTLVATGHLVRAGLDVDAAWTTLTASHPAACQHAKSRGRRWWVRHVWNHEVRRADDDVTLTRRDDDPALAVAVDDSRRALTALAYRAGPRARHSILAVAHALLDRILRQQQTTIPCPLRDLILDAGVRDRRTVSHALRWLHDAGFGTYNEVYDPTTPETSSHTFTLTPARAGEPLGPPNATDSDTAVLLHVTPGTHAPAPSGTWSHLPLAAHSIWRTLPTTDGATPTDLGRRAGLAHGPRRELTPQQTRTVLAHLATLARAGLAICTSDGTWRVSLSPQAGHVNAASATYRAIAGTIAAERDAFRNRTVTRWEHQRADAVARSRKQAVARQRAWWDNLDPATRQARRDAYTARFARLSVHEQGQLKTALAARRIQVGDNEAHRHKLWMDSIGDVGYRNRSVERAAWFAGLPPPLQTAYVQQWREHRERYDIPAGPTLPVAAARDFAELTAGPTGATDRDGQYLQYEQRRLVGDADADANLTG